MIQSVKFTALSLLGSGLVIAALLLIPVDIGEPPAKEKPAVQGKMADPAKKEEEIRKKIEEELRRKQEEERRREELAQQLKKLEEDRNRLVEEVKALKEAPPPPPPPTVTPEQMKKMIEEAVRVATAKPEQPPPVPPPLQVQAPKPEPAPELSVSETSPTAPRKGGFFLYVDIPKSGSLDALRRNGFALALADSEGFVTHVVELDASHRITGYRAFDRDDRSLYADVMFRIRDPGSIQGIAAVDRKASADYPDSSLKLLILRATFNKGIAPLIDEARAFSKRHRLELDGVRLRVEADGSSASWEGIYSKGWFYRK
jgi:hypothetical protein